MMLAIVKVLPVPVAPSKTWNFLPEKMPSLSLEIASGWSPVGLNLETISKRRSFSIKTQQISIILFYFWPLSVDKHRRNHR